MKIIKTVMDIILNGQLENICEWYKKREIFLSL